MNKLDFLLRLKEALKGLPKDELEERLNFYSEMIDDRIEEGFSEEEAVAAAGSVEEIAQQIIGETPLVKIVKEKIKPKRRFKAWEIVLLALGSPIWLSLGAAAFSVLIAVYASLWAVIVSLWSVFASFIGSSIGCFAGGTVLAFNGNYLTAVAVIGAALVCAGLSILVFYGCKMATKGVIKLTKKLAVWLKNCFIKKGEAQ